jgi:hypothetical protein
MTTRSGVCTAADWMTMPSLAAVTPGSFSGRLWALKGEGGVGEGETRLVPV